VEFADAQRDMRHAYAGGAPGVLVSSLAWAAAALAVWRLSEQAAVLTLFIGGALIFPLSAALCKAMGRSGRHDPANPLGKLAVEGTFLFLLGLPLAYGLFLDHPGWFFPAMLALVGGRYGTFQTVYGARIYWGLGAAMAAAGYAVFASGAPMLAGAAAGALIEMVFAALLFRKDRRALAVG
jgi:hypothetical protein